MCDRDVTDANTRLLLYLYNNLNKFVTLRCETAKGLFYLSDDKTPTCRSGFFRDFDNKGNLEGTLGAEAEGPFVVGIFAG